MRPDTPWLSRRFSSVRAFCSRRLLMNRNDSSWVARRVFSSSARFQSKSFTNEPLMDEKVSEMADVMRASGASRLCLGEICPSCAACPKRATPDERTHHACVPIPGGKFLRPHTDAKHSGVGHETVAARCHD